MGQFYFSFFDLKRMERFLYLHNNFGLPTIGTTESKGARVGS